MGVSETLTQERLLEEGRAALAARQILSPAQWAALA
jgi:hypothetical protein